MTGTVFFIRVMFDDDIKKIWETLEICFYVQEVRRSKIKSIKPGVLESPCFDRNSK